MPIKESWLNTSNHKSAKIKKCNNSFWGGEKLKHGKENYEDNSGKFKSKVWDHFLLDRKNYELNV